ncbi:Mur ligase family protein [Deinococcus deserti]|uniref:Putative UDP-N-acetylmuramoylalanyl-D-glutamate--2, 6-diaminopimelate ligase (MurE synthetase) (UDP-N-acetylmuramyl-tripeptide synthetase) putative Mur ligase family protein putative Cyanophycin sy... n=1 Tax=Deinococcus deserti (strain DSM 17065 / CIP 109153 / LMG 22923 / VCD115) TaxID=546414 RepID=C1D3U2_DEIDV|nr:Mur ligase family protein [Deinococcus deserti]ACO48171.1 putative UDP-N-acetylmuramoylalanyl-D-glutamate--2,6-diaminopimelate ligase (MurE synthetase) (UDP-N-acetylmuramyl-tripeptide synthetase); putative Mur ligase family protein; putative Cyanophycin synthetase [Deinococcus deserti VCD115]
MTLPRGVTATGYAGNTHDAPPAKDTTVVTGSQAAPSEGRTTLPMRVLERGVYRGPHVHSMRPMVRIVLDLGALEAWPTTRLPEFTDALLEQLPTLKSHPGSSRQPGGFIRRLQEGTRLGQVAQHIALELQSIVGERTRHGRTLRAHGQSGLYTVMYTYRDEHVGFLAGFLALRLVDSLLPPQLQGLRNLERLYHDPAEPALTAVPFDLAAAMAALERLAHRTSPDPATEAIVRAARRRDIPVIHLDDGEVQLGYGHHARLVQRSSAGDTRHPAPGAGMDGKEPDLSRSAVDPVRGVQRHPPASDGQLRGVAKAVLEQLFPSGSRSRIPILALTGTNGKSTTARMVAHILAHAGHTVGFTNTSGVYVADKRIHSGDATGPKSARMVLRHPAVTVAVLETARGGLLREGLGFDRADVGAVLNVKSDHLGLGGVNTVRDLARVKSLVVRVVASSGLSVLNADDPLTLGMRRVARGRIALFSISGLDGNKALRDHIDAGGLAVVCEPQADGDVIAVYDGGERQSLMRAADIPATLGGLARFNVENALAAAAMCLGLDLTLEVIRSALTTFTSSFEQSPGRLNVHDAHGFRVILDYAHNPDALAAQRALLHRLRSPGGRLIGMVSVPGDRRDDDIREVGEIAAGTFDELVFREGPDGRGRPRGETMSLMAEGARSAGFASERIHLVLEESDAVDATLNLARPGDIAVIMPTQVDAVWQQIVRYVPHEAR